MASTMLIVPTVSTLMALSTAATSPCSPRRFDEDSIVCVCNATYCDTIDQGHDPGPSNPIPYWYGYISSRDGQRMDSISGSWSGAMPNKYVFHMSNVTNQTIMGFGGAVTDAATITIDRLPSGARKNLIHSYYGQGGIGYTFARIPMGSCDFSTRVYSYDDHDGDLELKHFALQDEDLNHKIPFIKDAMVISPTNISLFGSPWSSPAWMKTNNNMTGKGTLKGQPGEKYYKAWAKYFVKFLEAYRYVGLDIWGLTAQNEPSDGMISDFAFQCLGFTPEMQRDFIKLDLGPALKAAGFEHVKLMILDDVRTFLPYWAEVILRDTEAAKFVSGIAVHWYEDLFIPTVALDDTYEQFGEDFFMLGTEACELDIVNKSESVRLGSWHSAERYFVDIVEDLSHGVLGWVDWNLALDMDGGPNWMGNFVDSPIIVNYEKGEFYKQPMFYAMAHFSKFVPPGAKVVSYTSNTSPSDSGLHQMFFEVEKRGGVQAVANFVNTNTDQTVGVTIYDPTIGFGMLNYDIPPKSFVTFTWWRNDF